MSINGQWYERDELEDLVSRMADCLSNCLSAFDGEANVSHSYARAADILREIDYWGQVDER